MRCSRDCSSRRAPGLASLAFFVFFVSLVFLVVKCFRIEVGDRAVAADSRFELAAEQAARVEQDRGAACQHGEGGDNRGQQAGRRRGDRDGIVAEGPRQLCLMSNRRFIRANADLRPQPMG